ncbi:MAG: hypothetical protein AB7O65_14795 [Candidatus Korobacteraceae bacterium]
MADTEIVECLYENALQNGVEETTIAVTKLRELLAEGSGLAGYCLATLVCPGLVLGSEEVRSYLLQFSDECEALYRQAFPLLLADADRGSILAMNFLSIYYQTGLPPVQRDTEAMQYWDERWDQEVAKRKGQAD